MPPRLRRLAGWVGLALFFEQGGGPFAATPGRLGAKVPDGVFGTPACPDWVAREAAAERLTPGSVDPTPLCFPGARPNPAKSGRTSITSDVDRKTTALTDRMRRCGFFDNSVGGCAGIADLGSNSPSGPPLRPGRLVLSAPSPALTPDKIHVASPPVSGSSSETKACLDAVGGPAEGHAGQTFLSGLCRNSATRGLAPAAAGIVDAIADQLTLLNIGMIGAGIVLPMAATFFGIAPWVVPVLFGVLTAVLLWKSIPGLKQLISDGWAALKLIIGGGGSPGERAKAWRTLSYAGISVIIQAVMIIGFGWFAARGLGGFVGKLMGLKGAKPAVAAPESAGPSATPAPGKVSTAPDGRHLFARGHDQDDVQAAAQMGEEADRLGAVVSECAAATCVVVHPKARGALADLRRAAERPDSNDVEIVAAGDLRTFGELERVRVEDRAIALATGRGRSVDLRVGKADVAVPPVATRAEVESRLSAARERFQTSKPLSSPLLRGALLALSSVLDRVSLGRLFDKGGAGHDLDVPVWPTTGPEGSLQIMKALSGESEMGSGLGGLLKGADQETIGLIEELEAKGVPEAKIRKALDEGEACKL